MSRPIRAARHTLLALLAVLAAVAAALVSTPAPAGAADNGAWSVTPTPPDSVTTAPRDYFVLEGAPGSTIEDKVRIQNWTKNPITFRLYGADGYNTEVDGFFALKTLDDEMTDLGSWVEPLTSQVTVYGRTQVDVPITITIPDNATPGDHVGGVVAMNVDVESTDEDGEALEVGIQRAVGSRMYLRVSGETAPGLEVRDVELTHDRGALPWSGAGEGTVTYTVENTGNLRLVPTTVIELAGMTGEPTTIDGEQLGDLLPGQSVQLSQPVEGVPWLGKVTATVTLTAEGGVSATGSDAAVLLPWPGLLLLLLLLGAGAWFVRRRRGALARGRQAAAEAPRITVPTDPTRT